MIIFPAIEIRDGQTTCRIRGTGLETGPYGISPMRAAEDFTAAGAEWLHIIDIDSGLRNGRSNTDLIGRIIDEVDVPVQVGGGIRTQHDVDWWLDRGAARVVLGTAAVLDRHMTMDVCGRHVGRVVISITGRKGRAVINGWRTTTSFEVLALARCFEYSGAAAIVYTDLDRLKGGTEVGFASTIAMGAGLEISVISSGMICSLDDVSSLALLPNVEGAVVGRALYEGHVGLAEAIRTAKRSRVDPEVAGCGMPQPVTQSSVSIRRIHHVGINVRDLQESINFYESVGFSRQAGPAVNGSVTMRHASGIGVELFQSGDRQTLPARICLGVSSISRTRAFMKHNHVGFAERHSGRSGTLWLKDPDNNLIELSRVS